MSAGGSRLAETPQGGTRAASLTDPSGRHPPALSRLPAVPCPAPPRPARQSRPLHLPLLVLAHLEAPALAVRVPHGSLTPAPARGARGPRVGLLWPSAGSQERVPGRPAGETRPCGKSPDAAPGLAQYRPPPTPYSDVTDRRGVLSLPGAAALEREGLVVLQPGGALVVPQHSFGDTRTPSGKSLWCKEPRHPADAQGAAPARGRRSRLGGQASPEAPSAAPRTLPSGENPRARGGEGTFWRTSLRLALFPFFPFARDRLAGLRPTVPPGTLPRAGLGRALLPVSAARVPGLASCPRGRTGGVLRGGHSNPTRRDPVLCPGLCLELFNWVLGKHLLGVQHSVSA